MTRGGARSQTAPTIQNRCMKLEEIDVNDEQILIELELQAGKAFGQRDSAAIDRLFATNSSV